MNFETWLKESYPGVSADSSRAYGLKRAFEAGSEAMRERAAKLVNGMDYSRSVSDTITYAERAIRALPVESSPPAQLQTSQEGRKS